MATKEEILRELYPEDLFHYADGLTLGEAEVLQETRRLIEKHLRPVINEYWEKPEKHYQAGITQKLIDLGVDMIIGSHPHTLQPIIYTENNSILF